MRDNHFREDNLREADQAEARSKELRDGWHGAMHEALKGSMLLNSGALIAMLGFAQSLIKANDWPGYKPFAFWAMTAFLLGAAAVPIAFVTRSVAFISALREQAKLTNSLMSVATWASSASILFLLLGAACAGYGLFHVF